MSFQKFYNFNNYKSKITDDLISVIQTIKSSERKVLVCLPDKRWDQKLARLLHSAISVWPQWTAGPRGPRRDALPSAQPRHQLPPGQPQWDPGHPPDDWPHQSEEGGVRGVKAEALSTEQKVRDWRDGGQGQPVRSVLRSGDIIWTLNCGMAWYNQLVGKLSK